MHTDIIDLQHYLDLHRYAVEVASDERLPEEERKDAEEMAVIYADVLLKEGTAFLDQFEHRRVAMH